MHMQYLYVCTFVNHNGQTVRNCCFFLIFKFCMTCSCNDIEPQSANRKFSVHQKPKVNLAFHILSNSSPTQ